MRIFIAIICCALLVNCNDGHKHIETITPKVMHEHIKQNKGIIVDVRTPAEYQEGHLKNAINIDFKAVTFFNQISKLDKNQPVYVYCRSGNRSRKSIESFKEAGFTKLYDLEGGILQWQSQGYEVVK